MMHLIEANHITLRYGKKTALNADAVSGKLMLGIRASVVFDAGWLR